MKGATTTVLTVLGVCLGGARAFSGDLDVRIHEIHYHPFGADDPDLEFVELHNRGAWPVDLSGWEFDVGIQYRFPGGTHVGPDGYVVVGGNRASFAARYPGVAVLGDFEGRLDNGGEILVLRSGEGREISRVHYRDGAGWSELADGRGPSLELLCPEGDVDRPDCWAPSVLFGGTPGAPNTHGPSEFPFTKDSPPRLRINEIVPALEPGGMGYLELLCTEDEELDLGRVRFSDLFGNAYLFPIGSKARAGEVLLIPTSILGFSLGAEPGAYALIGPEGFLDSVETEAIPAGLGWARYGDAADAGWLGAPSPGGLNSIPSLGRIVIHEVSFAPSYEPPAGGCSGDCAQRHQWVELYNRSGELVDVSGWRLSGGVDFTFAEESSVAAGGYAIVCASDAIFRADHPGVETAGEWTRGLGQREDTLVLLDRLGNAVDRIHYGNGKPDNDVDPRDGEPDGTLTSSEWPAGVSDSGRSIELVHPDLENISGYAWRRGPTGGTPGAPNRSYDADPLPVLTDVAHDPAVPSATDLVVVRCRAWALGGVAEASVRWRIDGRGTFETVPLRDDGVLGDERAGDSHYAALIPPQADGSIIAYTIELTSAGGRSATYPPAPARGGRTPHYLYEVDDDAPLDNGSVSYRIVMTEDDLQTLTQRDLYSDVLLNATFIAQGEVRQLVGIRYRWESSRRRTRKSYRLEFPPERKFRGLEVLLLNGAGNVDGLPLSSFYDSLATDLFRRSGVPYVQEWPVNLHFRGGVGGDLQGHPDVDPYFIRKEAFNRDFLFRYFGGSDGGNLYRGRDPQAGVGTGDLSYRGEDVDDYRIVYEKESNRDEDDYSDIVELTRAFSPDETPDEEFRDAMLGLVDVREWAAFFAIQDFCTNIDGGIHSNNGEDYFLYRVPSDSSRLDAGLWLILPWDLDESFNDPGAGLFLSRVTAVRRFFRDPVFASLYLAAIEALRSGAGDERELMDSAVHAIRIYTDDPGSDIVQDWRSYIRGRLARLASLVVSELQVGVRSEAVPGEVLIAEGDIWAYFKGTAEPSGGTLDWTTPGFDDSSWDRGPSGFGYGDGDDATELDDMRAENGNPGFASVYIRRAFQLPDAALLSGLTLVVDYDDGFLAYLNGHEIARSPGYATAGNPGEPLPHDFEIGNSVNHEASRSGGNSPEAFSIADWRSRVREGENTIALVGYNSTMNSSDFSLIPELIAGGAASVSGGGWGDSIVVTGPIANLQGRSSAAGATSVVVGGVVATVSDLPPAGGTPYGVSFNVDVPVPLGESVLEVERFLFPGGLGFPVDSTDLKVTRVDRDFIRVGGTVADSSTWTAAGGPYLLESPVQVPTGTTLTIQAGARIFLRPGTSLRVQGVLRAVGTESAPIVLRPFELDGRWGGVSLLDTGTGDEDPEHLLAHVDLALGGGGGAAGELIVQGAKARIESCGFRSFNDLAVHAIDSRVEILDSVFELGPTAIRAEGTTVAIAGCSFVALTGPGEAVRLDGLLDQRSRVERCQFWELRADGLRVESSSADVVASEFRHVDGTACRLDRDGAQGPSVVAGCAFRSVGTGVWASGGARVVDLRHDTIVFAETALRFTRELDASSSGLSVLHSMIAWACRTAILLEGPYDVEVSHSDIAGPDPWPGVGNVVADPRFLDVYEGMLLLRQESPCRNVGREGSDMGMTGYAELGTVFLRGDTNADETVNLTDPIVTLGHLFLGTGDLPCEDAADANDDGTLDITDAIFTLRFLFLGGDSLPPPYPDQGTDPTDDALRC